MIKYLRKKHLQIWRLWAVLLPLGIIAATAVRKPTPTETFAPPQNGSALPVVLTEKQVGKNLLQLRRNRTAGAKQLLWINREPLKVASATIYLVRPAATSINGATYVGRIETRGNYVFDLPLQNEYHFLLYDFIHQQVIDKITITPHQSSPSGATTNGSPTPNPKHQTPNHKS